MSNDPQDYPEDSFENMKRVAAEKRFAFPYVIDESQEVARAYGAVCTPEFFGFNAALELQYHGRVDEMFDAMARIAETGAGPKEQKPSIGCSIKWKKA
jgi:peroxiredoxin